MESDAGSQRWRPGSLAEDGNCGPLAVVPDQAVVGPVPCAMGCSRGGWLIPDRVALRLIGQVRSTVNTNGCSAREAEESTNLMVRLDQLLTAHLGRDPESRQLLKSLALSSIAPGKVPELEQYSNMLHVANCAPGGSCWTGDETRFLINVTIMMNLGYACHWDRLIKARKLKMVPGAPFVLGYNPEHSAVSNSYFVTHYL